MQNIRGRQDRKQKGALYFLKKKAKLSKNPRSINHKNTKSKQKQSSYVMREHKYYKHSQGLIKRAKQDTDTEKGWKSNNGRNREATRDTWGKKIKMKQEIK